MGEDTMTQHTPGPWTETRAHYIDAPNGTRIAEVYNWAPGYSQNARLIAAAPELLEALAEINDLSFALGGSSHTTTLDRIRTIIARTIAKATQGE